MKFKQITFDYHTFHHIHWSTISIFNCTILLRCSWHNILGFYTISLWKLCKRSYFLSQVPMLSIIFTIPIRSNNFSDFSQLFLNLYFKDIEFIKSFRIMINEVHIIISRKVIYEGHKVTFTTKCREVRPTNFCVNELKKIINRVALVSFLVLVKLPLM